VSLSLRNQQARFYAPSTSNDAGYPSTTYVTDGVYHPCRLTETRGQERLTTGAGAFLTRGVLELPDELTVSTDMLVEVDGLCYAVRGITRRHALRCLQLDVEWTDQAVAAAQSTLNGAGLLDGSGALDGTNPTITP
jgi:hypothetical protein